MATTDFKTYIGTKKVKAMPMGASEAKCNGANVTDETVINNYGVQGYLVEYEDGYRSWSPAVIFQDAYMVAESYTDRMAIELMEVGKRICKATEALYLPGAVPIMSEEERHTLREQLAAMRTYFYILLQRFKKAVEKSVANELMKIAEDGDGNNERSQG